MAPGREGTLEARLSPAPAGLPRGAPCTDARGARATNHLCRRRVPRSPSLGCVCRAGRGRPAPPGREPQRSPLSEAAGDANPWLSPRTLLGKVLHVPVQDTVWERPAAITARVPKDDGVAQETGPQGAMPRGLSIGTEVACSNLCHSPRLPPPQPRLQKPLPDTQRALRTEARQLRVSRKRAVCPTTKRWQRDLAWPATAGGCLGRGALRGVDRPRRGLQGKDGRAPESCRATAQNSTISSGPTSNPSSCRTQNYFSGCIWSAT